MKIRHFASAALSLCLLAGVTGYSSPITRGSFLVANASVADDYEYSINSDGTVTITKYIGDDIKVVIPSVINERTVTAIGKDAFMNNAKMTSVVFPSGLESIGYEAFFGCTGLTSVIIPGNVKKISALAFDCCSSLTSVTIGNGVETICSTAFFKCTSLTSITIPDSVTEIMGEAFGYCTSLKSIIIPCGVEQIHPSVFEYCTGLTNINVSRENPYYSDIDGILFNKNHSSLICYPAGRMAESYTPPISVTSIGRYSFLGCEHLVSVTVGRNVGTVGEDAFQSCKSLESVTFLNPNCSLYNASDLISNGYDQEIKGHAFIGTIYGYEDSTAQSYAEKYGRCFSTLGEAPTYCRFLINDDEKTVTITGYSGPSKNLTIPSEIEDLAVTDIADSAFNSCKSLISVTIDEGPIRIGSHAFSGCTGLTNVTIPKSVTSLGVQAFYDCASLNAVTILNPDCRIPEMSFDNGYDNVNKTRKYNGTIYGYEGSTAQAWAEKHGCIFKSIEEANLDIMGDVNMDGAFNIADVILLQKWLLAVPDTHLANWRAADFYDDHVLNVFDLCLMKRKLIYG